MPSDVVLVKVDENLAADGGPKILLRMGDRENERDAAGGLISTMLAGVFGEIRRP
jgi:hypothetical protein